MIDDRPMPTSSKSFLVEPLRTKPNALLQQAKEHEAEIPEDETYE
jgi:hypothetical protein